MQGLQFQSFGEAKDVLQLVELQEPPAPAKSEVQIEMAYAPINPNDFLRIHSYLPNPPALPAIAGNEGLGHVVAVGDDVDTVKPGDRVILPLYSGTWRNRLNVPAQGLFALPAEADPQQLAMLRINPSTAALLLSEFVTLKPGDWVVQNAANSGVGRAVIAIAKHRGFKTVNLVRRPELIGDLLEAGGDIVEVDAPDGSMISDLHSGIEPKLAIDGVSASGTARLARWLAPGATLVGYAMMGGGRTPAADLDAIASSGINLQSFYLGRKENAQKMQDVLQTSAQLIAKGKLVQPIAATYPLKDYLQALAHARNGGKVQLDLRAR
ncbi:zinc-dependent alcohol dehydrogenase family protein [Mesorhizobium sp. VK23B]|nr:zinc-dependent alcohol dehydrogenase family protein [Mesorhizobium sp. VK23A]MDX8470284.1 zinc-dependent alcohol dehydrogenase family protein [Mesorhizobium sp. VK23B]